MDKSPEGVTGEASATEKNTEANSPTNVGSVTATAVPTDAVVTEEKKPKGKKVLIGILCAVLGAGAIAGVTFALMNTVFKHEDVVPKAIAKILRGEGPQNVEMSGTITMKPGDSDMAWIARIKSASINLNAKLSRATKTSDVSVSVSAERTDGESLNFQLGERSLSSGDMYIKIDGINEAFIESLFYSTNTEPTYYMYEQETNCIDDPTGMTNCSEASLLDGDGVALDETLDLACDAEDNDCVTEYTSSMFNGQSLTMILGALSLLDGDWIKIPAGMGSSLDLDSLGIFNNQSQCLVSAMNNLPEYGKNLAELYNSNQFITYSTDDINIAKRKDNIYKLGINNEKMASFINGMTSSKFVQDLTACMGGMVVNGEVTADMVGMIFGNFPNVYAEIDADYNFTRLYFDAQSVVADLSFSYPASVEVSAPESYKDLTEVITNLLNSFFNLGTDVDTEVTTETTEETLTF